MLYTIRLLQLCRYHLLQTDSLVLMRKKKREEHPRGPPNLQTGCPSFSSFCCLRAMTWRGRRINLLGSERILVLFWALAPERFWFPERGESALSYLFYEFCPRPGLKCTRVTICVAF